MQIDIWMADIDTTQRFFADALYKACMAQHTQSAPLHCQIHDVLPMYKSTASTAIRNGLSTLQTWLPQLWGFLYQQSTLNHHLAHSEGLRAALDRKQYQRHLQDNQPDLVLALHPLALLPIIDHKCALYLHGEELPTPPLLAALLPQYHTHPSWIHPGIQHFFTAHHTLSTAISHQGIPLARQTSLGLPLPQVYNQTPSRDELYQAFQLDPEITTILVLADQLPAEQIHLLMFQLSLLKTPVQWMFDYGEDKDLARELREAAEETGLRARMFGQQAELQAFYRVSDFVICRPSPAEIAAILSSHTPLLLWPARPGADTLDAEMLIQWGVAVSIKSPDHCSAQLEALLTSTQPQELRRAAETLQPNHVNKAIVDQCIALIEQKAPLLAQEQTRFPQEYNVLRGLHSDDDDPPESPAAPLRLAQKTTPFEEIGQLSWENPQPITNPAAWKEAYAAILVGEKQLQRQLETLDEEISTWDERQALAQRHQQEHLVAEATNRLQQLEHRRSQLQVEWRQLHDEKQTLQQQRSKLTPNHLAPSTSTPTHPSSTTAHPSSTTAHPSSTAARTTPQEALSSAPQGPTPPTTAPSAKKSFDEQFQKLALEDELNQLKQRMRLDKNKLDISRLKDEDS